MDILLCDQFLFLLYLDNLITISGDEIPCQIPRKQARECRNKKDFMVCEIKIKKLDESDDFLSFEIEGDGLFLLEDFSVVGGLK